MIMLESVGVAMGFYSILTVLNFAAFADKAKFREDAADANSEIIDNLTAQVESLKTLSEQYKTILHLQMKLFMDLLNTEDPEKYFEKIVRLNNLVNLYNASNTFDDYRDALDPNVSPDDSYNFIASILRSYFRMDKNMMNYLRTVDSKYHELQGDMKEACDDMNESYQAADEILQSIGIVLKGQHDKYGETILVKKECESDASSEKEN